MNARALILAMVLALGVGLYAGANPIPPPSDTNMPLEDMYASLDEIDGGTGLMEAFNGYYYFDRIDEDVHLIKFPVPPKTQGFQVAMGKLPEGWKFVESAFPYLHEQHPQHWEDCPWTVLRELYPTVLPEWPFIPVHGWYPPWYGSFPPQAIFSVKYQHQVLKRGRHYIYFYALGCGKEYPVPADDTGGDGEPPFYKTGVTSYLDITMPKNYNCTRMFLDYQMQPFAVTIEDGRTVVSFHAKKSDGPFERDLIAFIRPFCLTADVNFDDKVDVLDLISVRNLLGTSVSDEASEDADVNGDGTVNILDLIKLRNNLGDKPKLDDAALEAALPPQIRLRYKVHQCGSSSPYGIVPDIRAVGRRMYINDQIYFNCCPEYVRMTIRVEGNLVEFKEKCQEEAPCDCLCYYPMKGVAGPFAPGKYKARLLGPHNEVIVEKEIIIH